MLFLGGVIAAEWACYKLADQGLANLLGLETLRHGTNLINYIGIKFFGGLPSQGHKATGSTGDYPDDTAGKFYVFKDRDFVDPTGLCTDLPLGFIEKRVFPNAHKFLSGGYATLRYLRLPTPTIRFSIITNIFLKTLNFIGGLVTLIVTPTLKFRVTREEISKKFQDDPKYSGAAYFTTQKVAMWKIGLLGTLTQGINFGVFSRACDNPGKILTGVVQLTAAVGLAALGMIAFPTASAVAVPMGIGLIGLMAFT